MPAELNHDTTQRMSRLSIKHLLVWSLGVAVAITLPRGIKVLEAYADQALSPAAALSVSGLEFAEVIIAACYGSGLSLAYFAIFGGPGYWRDPGRILITVLALVATLDLLLTYVALAYATYFQVRDIAGVDYQDFAPTYGYTVAIAIMAFVVIRSRTRWNWRIGWVGILLLSLWLSTILLVTGVEPLRSNPGVWSGLQSYAYANWLICFFIGTTIGLASVAFAVLVDVFRREPASWLLIVSVAVFTLLWCAGNAHLVLG